MYHDAHETRKPHFPDSNAPSGTSPYWLRIFAYWILAADPVKREMVGNEIRGFRRVAGVDLDSVSLEQARSNCRQMFKHGSKTRYNLSKLDILVPGIPKGTNLIYLFNPFGIKQWSR